MYIKCKCGHDVLADKIRMYRDGSLKLSGYCDNCMTHITEWREPDPVLAIGKRL